jgi:hypothetical protein
MEQTNITYLLLPKLHHVCVSLTEFTDIQSVTQVTNNYVNCVLGLLHHVDVGDAADVLDVLCIHSILLGKAMGEGGDIEQVLVPLLSQYRQWMGSCVDGPLRAQKCITISIGN